ncbi:MAG: isochorismate synthase [Acidimicrobiia bacterium]|nr:isochorismate synthase [Acidimicrobiia bacterium]
MPDSAAAADADQAGRLLDRAELAARADVPAFVVDLVIDAGLLAPLDNGSEGELFGSDDVDVLAAARTLVGEGVAIEELAALAMRHVTNVENLIDDAIDLLKRHIKRDSPNRAALVASVNRLVPVATKLVVGHFERTLWARAMARVADDPAIAAGAIVVKARHLDRRVDPLAVYASAGADRLRTVWLRPNQGVGLAAIGVVEAIEPTGNDRFSAASAARAVLAARIRRDVPPEGPAPVLVGGFSFTAAGAAGNNSQPPSENDGGSPHRGPSWRGFGDCRMVLPELTVIDREDGTWVLVATRVGPDGDEAAAEAALERQLAAFEAEPLPATSDPADWVAASVDCDRDDYYEALVSEAVSAIDRDAFHKVVLARTLTLDRGLDAVAVLDRLRCRNPACATFAFSVGGTTFLGATPEELVALDGSRLHTTALAGTAPRGDTPAADQRLAAGLLASAKNRSEHRFVVDGITEALTGLGLVDPAPAEPGLMRLNRVQHLHTPIAAEVQRRRTGASDMDVLRAAGVLHPTAAVGGAPTGAALEFIARHEGFDRGWYAAPVGWCDLEGNGEMGVALRCALTGPEGACLFAGAGVVADSVPAEELKETAYKLRALLDAIDER